MAEIITMNFDDAIVAHAEWKLTLTLYLNGEGRLDANIVCQDNQCKLGKWLYSDGKKYANEHAYEHLRAVHAKFHQSAAQVIKTVDDAQIDAAKNLIAPGSEYAKVSASVIEAISAIKRRVDEKTNLIMQNVNVGVLVIDRVLDVQSGYSQYCHELFDTTQVAGFNICDLLHLDNKSRRHFDATFEQVFDDILPPEVSLSMLPQRVRRGGKVLDLHMRIVRGVGDVIEFVLFTISDVTKVVALEAENAENAALLKVVRNREAFVNFLKDAKASLDSLLAATIDDQVLLRREVHTIKGNCGMFDMLALMEQIGEIESRERISTSDITEIRVSLANFAAKYRDVIGMTFDQSGDEIHSIAESDLAILEGKLQAVRDVQEAQDFVAEISARLRLRPARTVIGPVEERVHALAQRLGKSVECRVIGDDTLVNPRRVGPIVQVLSHVLRNAVDHGLEGEEERTSAGKETTGRVSIRFANLSQGDLLLVIDDDGRGIDLDRLVAKAVKSKAISASAAQTLSLAQKIELVFLDGVSTADEVSDISGRGVGMSALKASVSAVGGNIVVTTEKGKGTSVRIVVPTRSVGDSAKRVA